MKARPTGLALSRLLTPPPDDGTGLGTGTRSGAISNTRIAQTSAERAVPSREGGWLEGHVRTPARPRADLPLALTARDRDAGRGCRTEPTEPRSHRLEGGSGVIPSQQLLMQWLRAMPFKTTFLLLVLVVLTRGDQPSGHRRDNKQPRHDHESRRALYSWLWPKPATPPAPTRGSDKMVFAHVGKRCVCVLSRHIAPPLPPSPLLPPAGV